MTTPFCFLCFYAILWLFINVDGANWAQTSGFIEQNVVFPTIPSVSMKQWQARYGMATIVIPTTITADGTETQGQVFILGGDTYDGDVQQLNEQQLGLHDFNWGRGYKNDVWSTTGTKWLVKGDPRLRNKYHQKLPKVQSLMYWKYVTPGLMPVPGQTYENYIICQNFFLNLRQGITCPNDNPAVPAPPVQWSPRRHHAALYFNGLLWVFGGRAREFIDLPEIRSVGGILNPRYQDIPRKSSTGVAINLKQRFTKQREASVYKSDVWNSVDGISWTLVTPGCRHGVNQQNLVARGNTAQGKFGEFRYQCSTTADCYGAEICNLIEHTCVCNMWSPREQHAVAAYGKYMYVSGGYVSGLYSDWSNCGPYACGDTDASAFRFYMNDVWRSGTGADWEPMTQAAWGTFGIPGHVDIPMGRGGHQMLVIADKKPSTTVRLWVFGGRGGDNTGLQVNYTYYNDIWTAPFDDVNFPKVWSMNNGSSTKMGPWSPRTGHSVVFEDATSNNLFTRQLHLFGGYGPNPYYTSWGLPNYKGPNPYVASLDPSYKRVNTTYGNVFLDDVWTWQIDNPREHWRRDFTSSSLYGTGVGTNFHYNSSGPTVTYVTKDSNVSLLQRYWVPIRKKFKLPLTVRDYLQPKHIIQMASLGIHTINDLATANKYLILKLRGQDFPQVPHSQRMDFDNVCDVRALALAVVAKCAVQIQDRMYDTQQNMPWNVKSEFGGPAPQTPPISWWGVKDYSYLMPPIVDPVVLTDQWDGCTYNPLIQGLHGPNVKGLGYVPQVDSIRDPLPELQELTCKQTPGPRAYHGSAFFEGRFYIFGGKTNEKVFKADTWYRDEVLPTTSFALVPGDRSSDNLFQFACSEPGCQFEYRIWNPYKYTELRSWTRVTKQTKVDWMNWRKGGPGNGLYRMYVRAVDPSGNKDLLYVYGSNVYEWHYVSPAPLDIIFGVIGAFFGFLLLAYLEKKRRERKRAMERYAMKRMRRKFKAMQQDDDVAMDWRVLYAESKEAGMLEGKRKSKKKKKGGKDKKEKERMKREKEKEKIKKKIRMASSKGGMGSKASAGGNIFAKDKKKPTLEDKAKKPQKKTTKIYASGVDPNAEKKPSKVNPPGGELQKKLKDYEKLGMVGETDRERDRERNLDQGPPAAATEEQGAKKRFKDEELKAGLGKEVPVKKFKDEELKAGLGKEGPVNPKNTKKDK